MIPEFEDIKISSPDDIEKYTKRIETMIRQSPEYRKYLQYIYEDCQIRNCDYFTEWGVDNDIHMELHHIIPLYNLVQIAASNLLLKKNYIFTFDVAKEVILMHFENLLPTVILTKTIHEAVHANLYEIKSDSKSINIGEYTNFIKKYGKFISKKDIEIYKKFLPENDFLKLFNQWEILNGRST